MDNSYAPSGLDIKEAFLRRRKVFIFSSVLMLFPFLLYSFLETPTYRSSAMIKVERPQILDQYVRAGLESIEDQIQAIKWQVFSYKSMIQIAKDNGLYQSYDPELNQVVPTKNLSNNIDRNSEEFNSALYSYMRYNANIEIQQGLKLDDRGREIPTTNSFVVFFDSESPSQSQKITKAMADAFINLSTARRTERAKSASQFLASEADRVGKQVSQLEEKLANFKKENAGTMLGGSEYYTRLLENAREDRDSLNSEIKRLEERESYLKLQIAQARTSGDELTLLRAELADLQTRYSSIHPKIIQLKKAIKNLENNLSAQPIQPRRSNDKNSQALILLENDLQKVTADIKGKEAEQESLKQKIDEFQNKIALSSVLDKEFSLINRDYRNALDRYNELKNKEMEALTAEGLAEGQQAERFKLVSQADLPLYPAWPNIPIITLIGLATSLLFSTLLISFLEAIDPRIRGSKQFISVWGGPPIGIIPKIN